jgi:LacI family transcriptional regulator
VSVATVSRVINGIANKASPETERQVRRAVAELGYRPESAGRALRSRTSRLVAVLASNLANPTMAAIAATCEAAFRDQGLVMVLCDSHDQATSQDAYLTEMQAQRARVTVLLGAVASPRLAAMEAAGENLVYVNRRSPWGGAQCFVGIDNEGAGADVADHLAARVAGPLALLHGARASSATAERVRAFLARVEAIGRPVAPDLVHGGAGDHLTIGQDGMRRLLSARPRPAAVFCTSDLIAYGAHRTAIEAGVQVPEEVVLCGFDDNPLNPWVAPWLTSVEVPYARFGPAIAAAAEALDRDGSRAVTILGHRLVARPVAGAP